ncbi:DUF3094 family protein [Endozoicomonas ascidiicola]|uniref:DUF3094 family protein n=1 Tax=Endozoicomonas ascidiicola TaxID=1698521 RepID=UPI00082B857C|nr:DUF3094 family protein [Endozoicomonas ascidiicola]
MSSDTAKPSTNNNSGRLYPEDQAVVDEYLQSGINEVERPPFKPLRLMFWLTVIILLLGGLSQFIGYLIIPS